MDYRFVITEINFTNPHKDATEDMYYVDLLII
jgi:hypothetical protein